MGKLSEEDLLELKHRFGDDIYYRLNHLGSRNVTQQDINFIRFEFGEFVAFIVEDMAWGRNSRWKRNANSY